LLILQDDLPRGPGEVPAEAFNFVADDAKTAKPAGFDPKVIDQRLFGCVQRGISSTSMR
jgi:hypothetical protein